MSTSANLDFGPAAVSGDCVCANATVQSLQCAL